MATTTVDQPKKSKGKLLTLIIVALLLAILIVLFTYQNGDEVALNLLNYQFLVPLSYLLVGSLVLGALLVLIVALPNNWRRSGEIKTYRERIDKLDTMLREEMVKNGRSQTGIVHTNATVNNTDSSLPPITNQGSSLADVNTIPPATDVPNAPTTTTSPDDHIHGGKGNQIQL